MRIGFRRRSFCGGTALDLRPHGGCFPRAPLGTYLRGVGRRPTLGSILAAARVHGFQGKDLNDAGSIAACAKHFVGYGALEAGREYNTTDMSEVTLREVHLPPFKAALEAGVETI